MTLLCALPLISGLFNACAPPAPLATGYVEGEFVLVAPVASARIEAVPVARGAAVAVGTTLAIQETSDAEIALAEAEAALARAQSEHQNLLEGKRDTEIRSVEATLTSARAQATEERKNVDRIQSLHDRGIVPQAQLDEAVTRLDVAEAKVAETKANLEVARLPARQHEIAAAKAAVAQSEAARDAAAWQLDQRTLTAPADGTVYEILREAGEIAGPQAPVLSFLPEGAVILRVYVPETAVAGIAPGTSLRVNCDGCTDGSTASVSYVSDQPEFTPPVIYSLENRQKLVYLVEARPDAGAAALKPGQIVDVRLADPAR